MIDYDMVDYYVEKAKRDRAEFISAQVKKAFDKTIGALRRAYLRQNLYEDLVRMTDQQLNDIGLSRSNIKTFVRNAYQS